LIQRLAVVLWWIGGAAFALGIGLGINYGVRKAGCQKVFAEQAEYDRQSGELRDKQMAKAEAQARAEGRHLSSLDQDLIAFGEPAERAGLLDEVATCKSSSDKILAAVGALILSLPFLALAYVLGGSFFRPPEVT